MSCIVVSLFTSTGADSVDDIGILNGLHVVSEITPRSRYEILVRVNGLLPVALNPEPCSVENF
jgi:hypothetical protein